MKRSLKLAIVGVMALILILVGVYMALLWLIPTETITEISTASSASILVFPAFPIFLAFSLHSPTNFYIWSNLLRKNYRG